MTIPSIQSVNRPILRSFLLLAGASLSLPSSAQIEEKLSFNTDIRPILSDNCYHCHGQDANKREADLRLDNLEGALRDLGGYSALVPGNPDESELYLRITNELEDEQMPPPDSNRSLSHAEKETLRRWIEEGGTYDAHWAFVPPSKQVLNDPVKNPIDSFIAAKLAENDLEFSAEANPSTWLRRATLDLTGLPPTLEEQDRFSKNVQTKGEDAYSETTDHLLNSPHFGERLAADWLDASRYADTHGFNNDSSRTMWRWRDWVIDAFNQNMPYDQFITEQLAGDLLPNPTLEQRIATGFSRNHGINSEGGIIDEEYRVEYVADRVRTVGMVWMGLTTECARCHDHKYDPFTQEDYYRLFAFFNNVNELGEDGRVANAVPMIASPTWEQQQELVQLEDAFAEAKRAKESYLENQTLSENATKLAQERRTSLQSHLPKPHWHISDNSVSEEGPFERVESSEEEAEGTSSILTASAAQRIGQIRAGKNAYEDKSDAFSITFWIRPDSTNPKNAPLISNAAFDAAPSSSSYGKGWDIRLVNGEIEFAFAKRYPAYAAIARTSGANIKPNQWSHVSIVFTGRLPEDNAYTPISRFRVFVDGVEMSRETLHDGIQDSPKEKDRITTLGFDLHPNGSRFIGEMDDIQQFGSALDDAEIGVLFEYQALAEAITRFEENSAQDKHRKQLLNAVLSQISDTKWKQLSRNLNQTRNDLLALERSIPTTMVMDERSQMRATYVLNRGLYDSPGKRVEPGVPESWIAPWPNDAPKNRLGLAHWLTQPENPLTSRVVVNRFWQQLFGVGLVKTSEDFGVQSEYPSHPELLDWLAVDFLESGWDVKRFLKQIVLSQTYRQQSRISPQLKTLDPENRLLARGPRLRLPAEAIRDQALALSGLLNTEIGGPSVHPYQPENLYKATVVGANYPSTKWIQSEGSDLYRRSLYTFWKRTVPHPLMTTFDAPDREVCTVRRSRTNTPLQALALMNDPTFVEASRALAEKILTESDTGSESRLQRAFQMATGRLPNTDEMSVLVQALEEMDTSFRSNPSNAEAFLGVGESDVSSEHSSIEIAALTAVMSLILNLDETLTKG